MRPRGGRGGPRGRPASDVPGSIRAAVPAASTASTPQASGKRSRTSNQKPPAREQALGRSNSRAGPLPPKWKDSIMSDVHRDGQAAARHAAVIAELLARVQSEV